MKTAKRAWLFFALCCIFLMGSSLFRTGILELKAANHFSGLLKVAQGAKKQFYYAKMALFSPEKLDAIVQENSELRLQKTLKQQAISKTDPVLSFTRLNTSSLSKILLRPLEKWSSSLWIERPLQSPFPVEEDCPVVAGEQLLGLVEKVEGNACYVRLLGDPMMKVAVELLEMEKNHSEQKEGLPVKTLKLKTLRGAVEGIEPPYWGGSGNLMKGELYLHPHDRLHLPHPLPLEQLSQDLLHTVLVTSGLDGAFPRGLVVGEITKVIAPLEGECVFRFEANPLPLWNDLFEVALLQRRLQASP